jgi:redox-regulated HSP33 family molecular chaperone
VKQLNATTIAAKWANRVQNSGQLFQAGVAAVTVNPAQQAIAQADNWQAQVANAKQKFINGLSGVTLQSWQTDTSNAAQAYTNGATKGQPKMQSFMTQFIPALSQAVAALPPRGNLVQNQARAQQLTTALSQFQYQRKAM